MADTANSVYRDFVTDGVPASGKHDPHKPDIRRLLTGYENIISAFLSNGGLIYSSKATMDADLSRADKTMAWVIGDPTVANNGIYGKVGAPSTGSWTRRADLPFSFIIASDAGAGTPNAIQATTSIPVTASALIWMNVFEANTGSPVTVSFNAGTPLTIKTNAGNDVEAGGLVAGMIVLGIVSGSTFRLVSDQASATVLAGAEASRDAAEGFAEDAQDAYSNLLAAIAGMIVPALDKKIDKQTVAGTLTYDLDADVPVGYPQMITLWLGNAYLIPSEDYTIVAGGLHGRVQLTSDPNGTYRLYGTGAIALTSALPDGGTSSGIVNVSDVPGVTVTDALNDLAETNVDQLGDDVLALINGPKRMRTEKRIITSDWQCVPEQAVQITAQRALMADINLYHGDASAIDFPGDLIDRPTENNTGAATGYGFPELLADLRAYLPSIPTSRIFFIPGNHERDGTGVGSWRGASSLMSYREMIGKEFYYTSKGNFCRIYLGDMAGSVPGEIMNYAIDWFRQVLETHKSYNVIVFMHQPPDPTVFPGFAADSSYYQVQPARITNLIAAYDNIVACYYGHVHSSTLASVTTVTDAYGAVWINEGAGIPTCYSGGSPTYDIPYCVEFTEEGSTDYLVRRWNSVAHAWMNSGTYDVLRSLKFPAVLGGDGYDYDGRGELDPSAGVMRGPLTVYQSIADTRSTSAPYATKNDTPIPALRLIAGDDSNDDSLPGQGPGIEFYVPGTSSTTSSDSYPITGLPGYALGGWFGCLRASDAEETYRSYASFGVRNAAGNMEEIATIYHSDAGNTLKGLNIALGGVRVGNPDLQLTSFANRSGATMRDEGFIVASNPTTALFLQRQASDGRIATLYRGTADVGGMSVTGSGTSFDTTSDALFKDDDGELTFEDARAVLDLVAFHRFTWNERSGAPGKADEGVFAQELYEIYPKAVTPGYWYLRDDEGVETICDEEDEGAIYRPWSVDYSKLMTIVARCTQGLLQRHDDIIERIAALEAAQ